MKIGITCDLREDYLALGYSEEETLEFDRAETVESLEAVLGSLGYETDRIGNIWSLVQRLAAGERWDLVFNIAEGLRGYGREAQVPALLEAYNIPYTFSDPLVLSLTLHKGLTKRVVRDAGLPTPDFAVIDDPAEALSLNLPLPLFAKPVAEGTGKGVNASSKITSRDRLRAVCAELLVRYDQPVLVETFLPGREFTVGVLGQGRQAWVIGVMEVALNDKAEPEVYSAHNKEYCEELVTYRLADDPEAVQAGWVALAAYRALGCRDAGRVDLRSDARGEPNFIEINPLAGIHPQHSDLPILASLAGLSYERLIGAIIDSALERVAAKSGLQAPTRPLGSRPRLAGCEAGKR